MDVFKVPPDSRDPGRKGGGRETFAINLIPIDLTPAAAAAAV